MSTLHEDPDRFAFDAYEPPVGEYGAVLVKLLTDPSVSHVAIRVAAFESACRVPASAAQIAEELSLSLDVVVAAQEELRGQNS